LAEAKLQTSLSTDARRSLRLRRINQIKKLIV
jgi:hypothetical protein